ncbi:MAG: hypothetical protein ACPHQ9_14405 [Marinobacter sp.]|uniref:hypothetical protein n=1 Tax=Marinobacter sp. TaxID=50741 RepID=UPI003C59CACE
MSQFRSGLISDVQLDCAARQASRKGVRHPLLHFSMTITGDDVMKICTKCCENKPLEDFHNKKSSRDGKYSHCKQCKSSEDKKHYQKNSEKIKESSRRWREKNKDQDNQRRRERYESNIDQEKLNRRIWRENNIERERERSRKFYIDNKEKCLAIQRSWYERNKERCKLNQKRWAEKNRQRYLAYRNKYYRNKYAEIKEEPAYRLSTSMRVMLRKQFEKIGKEKEHRTSEYLGYSPEDLKNHLEKQFSKGMSWENYGEWHIDHIVPVSEHIRAGEKDPAIINCLTNLRPMWARENQSKNSKLTHLI